VVSYVLTRAAGQRVDAMVKINLVEQSNAEGSRSTLRQAQKLEKEFLLRPEPATSQKVHESLAKVQEHLEVIEKISPSQERQAAVKAALVQLAQVRNALQRVIDLHATKGFSEDQGLAELTVVMLMCRRHEKDYMLRGDTKYLAEIDKRIGEFEAQMKSFSLPQQLQTQIQTQW
jgi:methyl-accepting chemotaxis protein